MNVMKANMKELYFKRQDMFPLGNYFNRLKEFYNKLEELRQTEFELQKYRTMLYYINFPDEQVNSCVQTARKYQKDEISGACTYLTSEVARIFPEKYP